MGQHVSEVFDKSNSIKEYLLELIFKEKPKAIMLYQDFRQEVMTQAIIEELLKKDFTVLLPKTLVKEKSLIPYRITDPSKDLIQGAYGIWEPNSERATEFSASQIDMVVIPGVAFDEKGNRLGYGGGFYDRFLPSLKCDALKVALAFELQIVPKVYPQEHDCLMDVILTEKRKIELRREKG